MERTAASGRPARFEAIARTSLLRKSAGSLMASMEWFKLYSEARGDKKLQLLSDAQHRVWFDLLCFASDQPRRGTIIYEDMELLAIEVAKGDVELLNGALEIFKKLRMISHAQGTVRFINFEKRQARKPSDLPEATADRKRRQREREREMSRDVTRDEDVSRSESRDNDAGHDVSRVTGRDSKGVTPGHALDIDRDSERDRKDPPIPPKGVDGLGDCSDGNGNTDDAEDAANPSMPAYKAKQFDAIYKLYPSKKARAAAVRRWDRAKLPDSDVQAIAVFVQKAKSTPLWRAGVVPHFATFLHDRRWEDDLADYQRVPGGRIIESEAREKPPDTEAAATRAYIPKHLRTTELQDVKT